MRFDGFLFLVQKENQSEVESTKDGQADQAKKEELSEDIPEDSDLTPEERAYIKSFVHPAFPDAWHTSRLVMTKSLPDRKELNKCRSDLNLVGAQLTNDEAIAESIQNMIANVKKKTLFYHWCFYFSASSLDWGLANETKRALISDQIQYFHRNMRGMFVLARALDKTRKSKRYFFYLRDRYIELSQAYFGRELDPVMPPLDILVKPPKKPAVP